MKILVTGGASGLGQSITELLSKSGYQLIITYNSSIDSANKLKREYGLDAIQCDFNSEESVLNLISSIEKLDIDVLINNAFTGFIKKHFHKQEVDLIRSSFNNDIIPVLQLSQAAIKVFRKKKFGKIINILSSVVINKAPIGWSTYAATKAYLLSMNKSWANENAKFNITSNAISPSFMLTDLNKDVDARIIEKMEMTHPLKRLLQPEEVAQSVKYFVESSQQINGMNLVINAAENVI